MEIFIVLIFILGYALIALEHPLKINKAATALLTGVLCWTLLALGAPYESFTSSELFTNFTHDIASSSATGPLYSLFIKSQLSHHLSSIASILFFLLGAMTIVELVDAHDGFRIITHVIRTKDVRKLLWIVCWVAFLLSAVLDNLTTSIVMVSLVRKLIRDHQKRLFFAGMIVIAANAGGAWSPIGDVTTTMLWIGGQVSSWALIKMLLLPSVVCMLAPLLYLTITLKGTINNGEKESPVGSHANNGSILMLIAGISALVFVPLFKTITHLPPYIGMLFGLGVLWIISEMINPDLDEASRRKFTAAGALSRIDVPSILFFFGILLAVGALETMQTLHHFASYLNTLIGDDRIIISLIGVVSAIVDNVPLVAACMGMYSLDAYPADNAIWEYLAYCAGTGGSLLIIGSAAGVAVMGMEKIDFLWYLKKISLLALIGYVAGALVFLLMS